MQDQVRAAIAAGTWLVPYPQLGESWRVQEDIFEAYARVDFGGDHWFGNIGLRYADTEVESFGFNQILTDLGLTPADPSRLLQTFSADVQEVSGKHDYDRLLPSMNFGWNISENQILRVAYSETITRPTMNQLNPVIDFGGGGQLTQADRIVSAENPALEAFESKNYDVSYEWYFTELSYLSAAIFQKDTSGFLAIDTSVEDLLPGNQFGIHNVRRPRNGESAKVDGIELSFQYTFDMGLGIQSNATFVDSNKDFDQLAAEQGRTPDFTLEGLSDSANVVVFYEKGPV